MGTFAEIFNLNTNKHEKKLLLLVAVASFGFANAQIKEKGTFELTPKIGASSFAEFWDKDTSKYNSGVEFGVTADYYINNRWSLRSGLIFDKMGGKSVELNYV
jgi:long-subunit fatty acid transport protein